MSNSIRFLLFDVKAMMKSIDFILSLHKDKAKGLKWQDYDLGYPIDLDHWFGKAPEIDAVVTSYNTHEININGVYMRLISVCSSANKAKRALPKKPNLNSSHFQHKTTKNAIKNGMIRAMNNGAINPAIGKAGRVNTQIITNRKGKVLLSIEHNKSDKLNPFTFRDSAGVDISCKVEKAMFKW